VESGRYPPPVSAKSSLHWIAGPLGSPGTPLALDWEEGLMLWTLIVLVMLFWFVGFMFDVAGGLIHLLLLVALALFLLNIFSARRRAL
jgi:hypothetical protein